MIRAHVNAVVNLLAADTSIRIYRAVVPTSPTLPYTVMFAGSPGAMSSDYGFASTWREFRFHLNTVGSTDEQVFALAERIEARLLDAHPTVTGRSTGPVTKTLETPQPLQRDDDVSPPVLFSTEVWQFSSVPA